jgi:YD repeat-containing protein
VSVNSNVVFFGTELGRSIGTLRWLGNNVKVEELESVILTKTDALGDFVSLGAVDPEYQYKMVPSNPGDALSTTRTFYHVLGQVVCSVDARNTVTEYHYDAASRRTNEHFTSCMNRSIRFFVADQLLLP